MAKPLPLPVWDRRGGKLVREWMDDHTPTYESEPQRSITQWIKSQPLVDWLYAAYESTRWSARQIEPFVRKYHIDMSEFESREYGSFAEFFERRFRPGVRRFPSSPGEMGWFNEHIEGATARPSSPMPATWGSKASFRSERTRLTVRGARPIGSR
jgi:phosphatidylserine decarboxylase